jgi:hypothetical protein
MIRFIAGLVAGYVAMAVLVITGFSLAMIVPDFAFKPDSFDVTLRWIAYTLFVSIVAAMCGGFVAVLIAHRQSAAIVLAAVAFAIGMISAATNLARERPAPESLAGLSTFERAKHAKQPDWYAFLLPFVAAGGIALGGQCRIPRSALKTAPAALNP